MALPMPLLVSLLILSSVQASDIADGSTNHGLFSKHMQSRSEYSGISVGDTSKFMAHHLNHMKLEGPEALWAHYGLADSASVTVGSSHPDGKLEVSGGIATPMLDSPFTT